MSKIKVAEIFYSLQGEGRYIGVPSVFLRTFGCNFTCAGFGMPEGQLSTEADDVASNVQQYHQYAELPLVSTGCDSYASWHPAFKHLSPTLTIGEVAEKIVQLLPYKTFNTEHLVITGGEPLLGWQRVYPDLLEHELLQGLEDITFETNGTQPLQQEFRDYLTSAFRTDQITFSVSPKLGISGHSRKEAIKPEIVASYDQVGYTYLKYVIANENDAKEALEVTELYKDAGFYGPIYFMPCGGTVNTFNLNNKQVAELAMKNGVRYSDRLQIGLFGNEWGT